LEGERQIPARIARFGFVLFSSSIILKKLDKKKSAARQYFCFVR